MYKLLSAQCYSNPTQGLRIKVYSKFARNFRNDQCIIKTKSQFKIYCYTPIPSPLTPVSLSHSCNGNETAHYGSVPPCIFNGSHTFRRRKVRRFHILPLLLL